MASRSYAPRHATVRAITPRQPKVGRRTASVLVAGVGVATAATALAAPATAAPQETAQHNVWDRVASCESTQHWHDDTGNGYYGGLQFGSGTWRAYGGHKYAHEASGASRMEQIQVARRVLKRQGRDAWPVCGPRAGLTKSNGHATGTRLPGTADDENSSYYDAKHRTSHHATHAHHATHHARHATHHARHATHHVTRHAPAKSRTHHRGTYVVRRGDTLSAIARREHVHGGWHALWKANRRHVSNPNDLHVGQRLLLP